jgi:hypothetical protein
MADACELVADELHDANEATEWRIMADDWRSAAALAIANDDAAEPRRQAPFRDARDSVER